MDGCIVYTGIRLLLLINPFISSFSFLSNIQTLKKTCYTFFQEIWGLQSWNLVCTWTMGWCTVLCKPESDTAVHLSLYFFIFLSLLFPNMEIFVKFFSGTVNHRKLKLETNVNDGSVYCYTGISLLIFIHPFISSFFCLPNYQLLNCLSPQIAL